MARFRRFTATQRDDRTSEAALETDTGPVMRVLVDETQAQIIKGLDSITLSRSETADLLRLLSMLGIRRAE